METIYDLIVLRAGPTGLTARLYGGRYRLNTLLVERGQDGGQIAITSDIESYPDQMAEAKKSGTILIAHMTEQVDKFDVHRVSTSIKKVKLEGPVKRPAGTKDNVYGGKTVVITTGAHPRPTGCKNEKEFLGRGISFCTTCDANFYEDMEVYVMEGGDSTIEEAIYLTKFARKVTAIHRRDQLRTVQPIQEKASRSERLHSMWDNMMDKVRGDGILDTMVVRNVKTGELIQVNVNPDDGMFGFFGFIGYLPNTGLLEDTGLAMEDGCIRIDEDMHTNLPDVYTVGDVRIKSLRQAVAVAADGATATCQARRCVADLQ